jgi:hypothetical protein
VPKGRNHAVAQFVSLDRHLQTLRHHASEVGPYGLDHLDPSLADVAVELLDPRRVERRRWGKGPGRSAHNVETGACKKAPG